MRDLLLAAEARAPGVEAAPLAMPGHSLEDVSGHVELLVEAGFLKAVPIPGKQDETYWYVERLTYRGHEFLDTVRDPDVWRGAKVAADKVGGTSLAILADLAKAVLKSIIKDRLGFDLG